MSESNGFGWGALANWPFPQGGTAPSASPIAARLAELDAKLDVIKAAMLAQAAMLERVFETIAEFLQRDEDEEPPRESRWGSRG